MKQETTKRRTTAWAFVIAFLSIGVLFNQVGFLENTSPSLPYRYFIWCPHLKPKSGDITTFIHPQYGRLIKKLVGVEDNVIAYDENGTLYVAGQCIGEPLAYDLQGKPMKSVPPGIIPKGYVFCAGYHPESLDSRYPVIGLIREEALQGRLWGIK